MNRLVATGVSVLLALTGTLAAAGPASAGEASVVVRATPLTGGQSVVYAAGSNTTNQPGPCGSISLTATSNGYYGIVLVFNGTVGPAAGGQLWVGGNGALAESRDLGWLSGKSTFAFAGQLSKLGDGANGTIASGWAVTANWWFCDIWVFHQWQA
jgi:hypothetical protein